MGGSWRSHYTEPLDPVGAAATDAGNAAAAAAAANAAASAGPRTTTTATTAAAAAAAPDCVPAAHVPVPSPAAATVKDEGGGDDGGDGDGDVSGESTIQALKAMVEEARWGSNICIIDSDTQRNHPSSSLCAVVAMIKRPLKNHPLRARGTFRGYQLRSRGWRRRPWDALAARGDTKAAAGYDREQTGRIEREQRESAWKERREGMKVSE